MPLDEFIITVCGWVDNKLKKVTGGVKLRTRGLTTYQFLITS